ncbi:uncharacterized protein LOC115763958 isoform X6 [Drosophila novamexicana]|uniref:uncharacterized protein LOC115763958 isoform X6 n=1 Tax=Drosophila novamexicana TaxID=47314 RepID=UPI0011E5D2CF|nr:uncharacterized protein LOC115763958 isoform X6 [Drosophila novamexicana]
MVLTRSTSVFNIFVLFLIINLGFAIPGSEIEGTKPKDTLKKLFITGGAATKYSMQ